MKRNAARRRERKRVTRKARLAVRRRACGLPPGLLEALGGEFDVIQHGPDEFEFVAKDAGEAVKSAA